MPGSAPTSIGYVNIFVDCCVRLIGAVTDESAPPISPRMTLPMLPATLLRFFPSIPCAVDFNISLTAMYK